MFQDQFLNQESKYQAEDDKQNYSTAFRTNQMPILSNEFNGSAEHDGSTSVENLSHNTRERKRKKKRSRQLNI